MRKLLLVLAIGLLVAACSGDDDAATTVATGDTEADATTTTEATGTTAGEATTTTAADATTTTEAITTSSTTSTTVAPGPGVLAMTRIVFEPVVYITITNVGNGPAELGSHWLCRRPAYIQLPSLELAPGDTVAIGLDDAAPPDLVEYVAVLELGNVLGPLDKGSGELGLYTDPFFDDAGAILDYVEWGSSGHGRSNVAVAAGIWQDGSFVDIPEEAMSISSSGTIGAGPEDWFVDIGG